MRHVLRPVAAVAAGLMLATTLAGPAAAAADDRSGRWLKQQLTGGLVHNNQYDFDDYGLTADLALALDAIGGQRKAERKIRRAIAPHVDSWTTGADWGSSDVYAGSVAKAVVLAQATGGDPTRLGGKDLVQRLEGLVSNVPGQVGRIEDETTGTDYANTIGQAFAARGLARAGSDRAGDALRFLLQQQCDAGYFRLAFAPKAAPDQSCDGGDAASSAPSTDVTALSVINLLESGRKGKVVRNAVNDAVSWLKQQQKTNGSFGGSEEGSNTNSTGLAAWALGERGSCRPAVKAAGWVDKLTVGRGQAGTPLAGETGAIAYDRAGYRTAKQDGITVEAEDQWRRATTQAAPALSFLTVEQCRNR
ncbi:hypothetical protein ACFP3Q_16565 [Nocardioides sp. GCM10027113]|uniref:hypothetical protein n=1 Tax=unclassified Nocardioides TaxID=2615069 RepID=UPI0036137944